MNKPRMANERVKKRKGFKTSPSLRIPRAAVKKFQARIRQLEAALTKMADLHARLHKRLTDDNLALLAALKDAMAFLKRLQNTKDSGWTAADVKRMEEIRLLSLGV